MTQGELNLVAALLYTTRATVEIWADAYGDEIVMRALPIMVGARDPEGAKWYAEYVGLIASANRHEKQRLCTAIAAFADFTMAFLAECDRQKRARA